MITKVRSVLSNHFTDLKKVEFAFGCFVYFSSALLVLAVNKDVAGSRFDSQFYLSSYSWIASNHQVIPLDQYKVASNPIFVHLMGILGFIVGDYFTVTIHVLYILMAIASIWIVTEILDNAKYIKSAALSSLLFSSGYFVAPSLWPTSDLPSILFMLLSYYFFFRRRSTWLFSLSLFALLSTRQSFAWLCLGFLIFDLMKMQVYELKNFSSLFAKYLPSFFSLWVSFVYFDFEFAPKFYENVQRQNVFQIPNFLSTIQIGLNFTVVLLPIILFLPSLLYRNRFTRSESQFLLIGGLLTLGVFLNPPKTEISSGLSWLSVAQNRANIPLQFTALIAFAGFIFYFSILAQVDYVLKMFLYVSFILLCISALLMSIPFLRYFEISSYFLLMLTMSAMDKKKSIKNSFWLPVSIILIFMNWLKILL